ncbi:pyruvate dehydrogenase complex dihydrolipoamide acetyltransferase [Hyphomonas jannaschiana]|uniref:Acetyltransferase component of pyruvate dehydrogenase complex n=1 Tax=Hyphomonas jannaschiana VP2 TaxID=1280952 RepID=A0A059FB97_9PROT|nr:pyruvate dehydrogenase complex dihydrolipoamide acetyltransferase [Hyphomonas jannaschiana]KCZ87808.1 pyruvate dehydrogenase complex, E2 component, dihydrolipoyllysine-residue acetyltransferase [Hyphomonas jannaschiana VP2]
MSINITMPALSPTMEEGTLSKWLVKEGDTISSGDVIAEIETDKATMEVEAVDEGTVAKLLVAAGTEGVKVNAVIAVLAEEGEDPSAVEAPEAKAAPEPAKEAKKESSEDTPKSEQSTPKSDIVMAKSDKVGGSQDKKELATTPLPSANTADGRIKASPLARRIADMKGIDLSSISGTGPRGRIIKRDVENAKPGAAPAAASAAAPKPDGLILPQVLDDRVYAPDSYELKPLDGMRKTVARRLTESFMQVPHFPLNVDLNIDRLLASRSAINAAAEKGIKISVNDMLIKAAALALMDEPDCNASYTDKGIAYHKHANVSVAVAIDGGLITPVIFKAEEKGLSEISKEMKDLAERARDRKLKPQEYTGGTFSISNLGMFGIKSFASIINPPEGMILSVGAGEKRAVVNAKGNVEAATIMTVTLTCDHRVIGGAEGAKWLQAFKRYVETPEAMLL